MEIKNHEQVIELGQASTLTMGVSGLLIEAHHRLFNMGPDEF